MDVKYPIEIKNSKIMLILLTLAAIAAVIGGVHIFLNADSIAFETQYKSSYNRSNWIFRDPNLIRILGFSSFSFFGLAIPYAIKKIFNKDFGLIIDEKGIYDNSSGVSAGLILWQDIIDINFLQVQKIKFIQIIVSNPDYYIYRKKNIIFRFFMFLNKKIYGTPISISSTGLKCSFDELDESISIALKKFKISNQSINPKYEKLNKKSENQKHLSK